MTESHVLEVRGVEGRLLRLRYHATARPRGWRAVIWPGLRYGCDKPLLYYAAQALLARGADVVQVLTTYEDDAAFRQAAPEARWQRLLADGRAVLDALRDAPPQGWIWVGKSLGTLTMAALWADGRAGEVRASVWLTPLLAFPALQRALQHGGHPALVVAGRKDPTFAPQGWQAIAAQETVQGLLLEEGNHSLEVPGDLGLTLDNLRRVALAVDDFLAQVMA